MTEREKMEAGMIYDPGDPEILAEQQSYAGRLYEYNATQAHESEKREVLLKEMFGKIGEGCFIEPPFRANWAGKHVFLGDHVYANFNLTLVDDGRIEIGDRVMIGPNVTIASANHPISPKLREQALQMNQDVRIGRNVWIGSCAVILPGVTIGENSVIGAGSVVTRDIPPNVVAVGNPCRVLREIRDEEERG